MRYLIALSTLIAVLMAAPAFAAEVYNTEETPIGTLLDDPKSRAILDKLAPGFADNPQTSMARPMTLSFIAPYSDGMFSDEVMEQLDAEFKKLAAE